MDEHLDTKKQQELAKAFHSLHHNGTLILPNIWDCASAMVFEKSGFPALGTTSSGVAWAHGFRDGEGLPPEYVVESTRQLSRVLSVPLSIDAEAGYFGGDLVRMEKFFEELIDAGAVGINLEDWNSHSRTLYDTEYHCKVIRLAVEVAKRKNIEVFVNARTDAYEKASGTLTEKLDECIRRAAAYRKAGADGIFVPFVMEIESVARLKSEIELPLNVLINQNLKIEELKELGINRVSIGGKAMMSGLGLFKRIAEKLKSDNWDLLYENSLGYPEINNWF